MRQAAPARLLSSYTSTFLHFIFPSVWLRFPADELYASLAYWDRLKTGQRSGQMLTGGASKGRALHWGEQTRRAVGQGNVRRGRSRSGSKHAFQLHRVSFQPNRKPKLTAAVHPSCCCSLEAFKPPGQAGARSELSILFDILTRLVRVAGAGRGRGRDGVCSGLAAAAAPAAAAAAAAHAGHAATVVPFPRPQKDSRTSAPSASPGEDARAEVLTDAVERAWDCEADVVLALEWEAEEECSSPEAQAQETLRAPAKVGQGESSSRS